MDVKGVLLSKPTDNGLWLYICVMDLSLFDASMADLLPDFPQKSQISNIVAEVRDVASGCVSISDSIHGLASVEELSEKFPAGLTDPSLLDFDSFFARQIEYTLYDGIFVFSFAEFRPIYKVLAEQEGISVGIAYTGWIRAYYRKKNETPEFYPYVPPNALPFLLEDRRRLSLPVIDGMSFTSDIAICETGHAQYGINQWSWADLLRIDCWYDGEEIPFQGHYTKPYPESIEHIETVLTLGFEGVQLLLSYTDDYTPLCSGFNADYPSQLKPGCYRVYPTGYVGFLRRRGSYDGYDMVAPIADGTIRPPLAVSGFGGVLAGVFGIATKTGVLNSVWRKKESV